MTDATPPTAPSDSPGVELLPAASTRLTRGQLIIGALALSVILTVVIAMGLVLRGRTGQGGIGIIAVGRALDITPRPAPDFQLTTYEGRTLRLSDYRGQVVVINFWASWCPPCRAEAPVLEEAWVRWHDRGVVVVGIDVWDDQDQARAFLEEFGVTYANAEDTTRAIPVEYGVTGLPETYVVDRRGVLVRRWVGPIESADLDALIAPSL